eukprot:TRINITY_DN16438_c0_g1_i1.p1 TRINITY_DN16438_c0_g1~~TRINITY_DN16438_c0_g1_i1.p1  ORF type:complete len:166 (-),score=42.67 TRINITY_DN16438_c0_g1_i1:105-548(-)
MDNDMYGHVNNVVYYSFFDTIVNHFLIRQCGLNPSSTEFDRNAVIGFVVESKCKFIAPLEYPDVVYAGLKISKIGSSSVTYSIGIFRKQGHGDLSFGENGTPVDTSSLKLCAEGQFVHVFVDPTSRRPKSIPEQMRRQMGLILQSSL